MVFKPREWSLEEWTERVAKDLAQDIRHELKHCLVGQIDLVTVERNIMQAVRNWYVPPRKNWVEVTNLDEILKNHPGEN